MAKVIQLVRSAAVTKLTTFRFGVPYGIVFMASRLRVRSELVRVNPQRVLGHRRRAMEVIYGEAEKDVGG